MAAFNGKWRRVSAENADALIDELGASMDVVARIKSLFETSDIVEELKVTDTEVERRTYVDGQLVQNIVTKFGELKEKDTSIGTIQIVGHKISDRLIKVDEIGENHKGVMEFRVCDDTLYIDFTINETTARRTFRRLC